MAAVRDDLADYVKPEIREALVSSAEQLLLLIQSPSRLYDFSQFARVFVRQCVPTQVLLRWPPVIYSPARLEAFGLP